MEKMMDYDGLSHYLSRIMMEKIYPFPNDQTSPDQDGWSFFLPFMSAFSSLRSVSRSALSWVFWATKARSAWGWRGHTGMAR